ncbi:crocetin glucosyltransferase, chloroplastic-like [Olea europaea var. sylvestris]|uniref:anthocyanidin 3-O-glucoside 5-O-glucosyltransferase n=1 Tax=Olea europaea subsp. europaea TaxID=158383 RepID=A0A8S0QY51_OLEEU|nr:crocetin glucosyltransferase, chloroplastic-like [Olea europaea var. sylvestris]CAA2971524.1 crocetin glucosyltransferase, chloroplastic-like [Olea europaea subsp. europaea]
MVRPHVLLVTFPAQGHINPLLTFAKTLVRNGIEVTFSTSLYAQRRIAKAAGDINPLLTFAAFSDGYDDGCKQSDDHNRYMAVIRNSSSNSIRDTVLASAEQGRPVTCLVYSLLLPWAAAVARELQIPSALLWIQPTTVLDIYYYYFNGYGEEINNSSDDPSWTIQLPGLPLLAKRDLPSFVLPPSSDHKVFALSTCKEHLEMLDAETKPKVLVNTFDALQADALKAIEDYELIGIGPLIPSAFLDGKDPSDKDVGGDLFNKSEDYLQWLNSMPESSVIYVSFGTLLRLPKVQMEEIAKGLLECGRPFLWVIRVNENSEEEKDDNKPSRLEELEKLGNIVPWCSQLEVLTHPSLGCFVTHCGWNSTLECIACGVPVVAFPQWADQGTNAKLIQDVWRTGLRVNPREDGIVESYEIKRCIETIMGDGEKSGELRENAWKWKNSAREAMQEDGSSTKNLKVFVEELVDYC